MNGLRKRNSLKQNLINTWYNGKLFHVNGKPLKFYLQGCNNSEFCSITQIVQAYGGKLSEPAEDTIIFTEQDNPIGINQCYHIKYFRDCIVANQLLDLEKYKLSLSANHCKVDEDCPNHEEVKLKSRRPNIRKPKTDSSKFVKFEELNTNNRKGSIKKPYSEDEDRKIMKYIIRKKLIARTGSLSFWKEMVADNIVNRSPHSLRDHFRRKLIYEYEQYTSNAAARKEFKKLLEKHEKSTTNCYQPPYKIPFVKWSDEENQSIMDYIVKNKLYYRMKGRAICCEIIEKAGLKNKRSVYSVQSQIRKLLYWGYQDYITDPQALKEIAAIQNKLK